MKEKKLKFQSIADEEGKKILKSFDIELNEMVKREKSKLTKKDVREGGKGTRKEKARLEIGKSKEKIPQKPERTKEDIIAGIKAAAEVGDEEQMAKPEKELEDFDKTGEQLFKEAQALEAEEKAKKAAGLDTPEKRQKEINDIFPKKDEVQEEIKRSMEEVEKRRQREADEKIKEFFSGEEVERKGVPISRMEELEKLKGELETARKDYLKVDYKKKKAWKRMADFFGKFIKSDQGPENDEILHFKDIYLHKLFDYKNALLEDAKARAASNKELGDLVKLFGAEVNCNLADVRDQVKMENQEGKLLGFFTKHSKDIIGWYSKLPRYKKLAIGAAFGLTAAAGAGFGGAAAAGAMGMAVSAKRIFMGAVTGTGVALGAEAFLKRRTEKGIENNARAITEQFEKYESLTLEEKLKLVDEKIKWAVGDIDKKIARHKKTKLAAASLGILAGTVIGSGIASELFGEGFKKTTGFAKRAAEYFGYHLEVPVPVGGVHAPEIPAGPEAPEVPASDIETAEKGDSIWKMAERQLKDRFGNQFTDLDERKKTYIIDAIKDKIAENTEQFGLENADKITEGQQIDFSGIFEDKPKISELFDNAENLTDAQVENIGHNNEVLQNWTESHPGESLTSEKVEEILRNKPSLPESAAEIAGEKTSDAAVEAGTGEKLNELIGNSDNLVDATRNLRYELAGGALATWVAVKDTTFPQAMEEFKKEKSLRDKLSDFRKNIIKILGNRAKPKRGEKIKEWTKRIARLAAEKK